MGAGIAQVAAQAGHAVRSVRRARGRRRRRRARSSPRRSTAWPPRASSTPPRRRRSPLASAPPRASTRPPAPAWCRGDRRERRGQARRCSAISRRSSAPTAILASNTSSISITALANGLKRAGPLRRHALLQPGAADEAGRGRLGPADRCRGRRGDLRARPSAGARRRCTRARRRASSSTASPARTTPRRSRCCTSGSPTPATIDALPARRRLSHGAVRADGPDRPRHQLRGHAVGVRRQLRRQALRAVAGAARDGRRRPARTQVGPRLLRYGEGAAAARRPPPPLRGADDPARRASSPCTAAASPSTAGRRASSRPGSASRPIRRAAGTACRPTPASCASTDGRAATQVAAEDGVRDLAVFDLADRARRRRAGDGARAGVRGDAPRRPWREQAADWLRIAGWQPQPSATRPGWSSRARSRCSSTKAPTRSIRACARPKAPTWR